MFGKVSWYWTRCMYTSSIDGFVHVSCDVCISVRICWLPSNDKVTKLNVQLYSGKLCKICAVSYAPKSLSPTTFINTLRKDYYLNLIIYSQHNWHPLPLNVVHINLETYLAIIPRTCIHINDYLSTFARQICSISWLCEFSRGSFRLVASYCNSYISIF